ncbi:MAG: copper resistance protein NlpE N-terminal domain-containing protein [Prevotellaceae bacterium]|jgi:copper homeostasis protein (lipoprotein)|nr:copper resistance protein NlpE N-terminal domain-containing protein [Prevotellaceae bacterium]
MKKISLIFAVMALLLACNSGKTKVNETTLGTYEGILPCADCAGINTVLRLYKDGDKYMFELKETYLGKGDEQTYIYKGVANVLNELDDLKNATIYELFSDDLELKLYFMAVDGNLQMLDTEGKIINSTLNYTLIKK